MQTYKVFNFDSRNSVYYTAQGLTKNNARDIAIRLSKETTAHKAQIESEQSNYFEQYEYGEKTEWSLIN